MSASIMPNIHPTYDEAGRKQCSGCGKFFELSTTNFNRAPANSDGFNGRCKSCVAAVARPRYLRNRERILAAQKSVRQYEGPYA
jgi:ribosomal protein L31